MSSEKTLWLMVSGGDPIPVRRQINYDSGFLEGLIAFTIEEGDSISIECGEDASMRVIEVDPVQFCHQMAGNYVQEGIDLVFVDDEPHPLTLIGAKHALEITGDLTWHRLQADRDVVKESIRRLRRMLTFPDEDSNFKVTWSTGQVTSHPRVVQEQLEAGNNVYASNDWEPGEPKVVDMILPVRSDVDPAPILADTPDRGLRMFVIEPEWLNPIIDRMERLGKTRVQFWAVADGQGGVELLGPVS